ncbi:hypothetical protein ACFTAO_27665 [Paenibacillus rhizoplanae]
MIWLPGGPAGRPARLFRGDSTVVHRLYLGHTELLGFQEAGSSLSVYFNKPDEAALSKAAPGQDRTGDLLNHIDWFCFDEEGNSVQLYPSSIAEAEEEENALWRAVVRFDRLTGVHTKTLAGYGSSGTLREWPGKWIFAELKKPITTGVLMPDIEDIRLELNVVSPQPLPPDVTVNNGNLLDMGKDYYPLGGQAQNQRYVLYRLRRGLLEAGCPDYAEGGAVRAGDQQAAGHTVCETWLGILERAGMACDHRS